MLIMLGEIAWELQLQIAMAKQKAEHTSNHDFFITELMISLKFAN